MIGYIGTGNFGIPTVNFFANRGEVTCRRPIGGLWRVRNVPSHFTPVEVGRYLKSDEVGFQEETSPHSSALEIPSVADAGVCWAILDFGYYSWISGKWSRGLGVATNTNKEENRWIFN
jgi:hypothetical protein